MSTIGYGVCTENAQWNKNAAATFFNKYAVRSKRILSKYFNYRSEQIEENRKEEGDVLRESDLMGAFCSEYENGTYCWTGLEAIIVDTINDIDFAGKTVFRFEDHCIYVAPEIPANEYERQKMLTQEEIGQILSKYLDELLPKPLNIAFYTIHE